MKKIVILFWLVIPLITEAQTKECINFSMAPNWQEVLKLAKKTNKSIFVDLYATWCVPCKMMDRDVYTNKQVAEFANKNFISIKVQMDSTKNDNEFARGWRTYASNWNIYATSFPTYLFYTADGQYSGKEEGYYKPEEFLLVLKKNLDPKSSYLAQVSEYKAGNLSQSQMLKLAYWAKSNKDDSMAYEIAGNYKRQYVDKAPIDSLLNPQVDRFQMNFHKIFSFSDKLLQYMYDHPKDADIKLNRKDNPAGNLTDFFINRDYIANIIYPNKVSIKEVPKWKMMKKRITKKFDKRTAKRVILNAKIIWAYEQKNFTEAVRLEFERIDRYGLDTTDMGKLRINNIVYDYAFKHVDNVQLLKKALYLMRIVVEHDSIAVSSHLDTYASILYKFGKKNEAIAAETEAMNWAIRNNDSVNAKFFAEMIRKMKGDIPIWRLEQ